MNLGTVLWLHQGIGNAAPIYMALWGILSIINYIRGRGVDGSIIGAVIIGELMMMTMVGLGVTLLIGMGGFSSLPGRGIHFLYGSLAIIFLPGLWVYTRGETDRRASLIWGLAGIFMMGLTLRAIGTATG